MSQTAVYVGIDVSKEHLDVLVRPSAECQRVRKDEEGIRSLIAQLQNAAPVLIVLESTGGHENGAVAALAAAALPVVWSTHARSETSPRRWACWRRRTGSTRACSPSLLSASARSCES